MCIFKLIERKLRNIHQLEIKYTGDFLKKIIHVAVQPEFLEYILSKYHKGVSDKIWRIAWKLRDFHPAWEILIRKYSIPWTIKAYTRLFPDANITAYNERNNLKVLKSKKRKILNIKYVKNLIDMLGIILII